MYAHSTLKMGDDGRSPCRIYGCLNRYYPSASCTYRHIAADVNTGSLLGKVLLDIVGADRNGESTALGNSTARHAAFSKSENAP